MSAPCKTSASSSSKTNRLDQAVAIYRQALEVRPGDAGLAAQPRSRLPEEGCVPRCPAGFSKPAECESATDRGPRDPGLLYILTRGYLKQNPTAEGRHAAGTLLNSVPPAPAGLVLCQIYFESARYDEAIEQCRKTLAADPHFPGYLVANSPGKALAEPAWRRGGEGAPCRRRAGSHRLRRRLLPRGRHATGRANRRRRRATGKRRSGWSRISGQLLLPGQSEARNSPGSARHHAAPQSSRTESRRRGGAFYWDRGRLHGLRRDHQRPNAPCSG